jgi:hypothetical protein
MRTNLGKQMPLFGIRGYQVTIIEGLIRNGVGPQVKTSRWRTQDVGLAIGTSRFVICQMLNLRKLGLVKCGQVISNSSNRR